MCVCVDKERVCVCDRKRVCLCVCVDKERVCVCQ